MMLLIDNYDSFTYNLAQYFGELGCDVLVKRNDEISIDEIAALGPDHICVSPGPGTPREAGISKEVIQRFGQHIPVLGVCLGHQCIAEAYGGKIVRGLRPMHGKPSRITHDGSALFSDLSNPFEAARYHSLAVERSSLPACLEITAESEDAEIMALRHRDLPVLGVQFHPESVLTQDGKKILARFLALARKSPTTPQNPLMHETLRKDPENFAASPLAARGED